MRIIDSHPYLRGERSVVMRNGVVTAMGADGKTCDVGELKNLPILNVSGIAVGVNVMVQLDRDSAVVVGTYGVTAGQGPAGPEGPMGPEGPPGPAGPQGVPGPQGIKGDTGAQGPTGATGATGPQGVKGDTGAQGPAGATGATGPEGPAGATGAQGPKGDKGDTGAQGPPGPTAVSTDAVNLATLGTDGKILVQQSTLDTRYVNVAGDAMTGPLAMGTSKITGLGTPTAPTDAATMAYVDSKPAPPAAGSAAPKPTAAAAVVGVATPYSREDHVHVGPQPATTAPPATAAAGAVGASALYAREDHAHAGPQPASIVSPPVAAAAVVGTSATYARQDHVHVGLDQTAADSRYVNVAGDTMAGALAMGGNAITGLPTTPTGANDATSKSYVDGKTPPNPGSITPAPTGAAGAVGTALPYSREDHVHAGPQPASATPPAVGTGAVGTSALYARQDHTHTGLDQTTADGRYVNVGGDAMTGALAMGGNAITGLATPSAGTDAATKAYVDSKPAPPPAADAAPPATAAASALGVSTDYAREDHTHAGPQPASAAPPATGAAGAVGSSALYARQDHVHAGPQPATVTPAAVAAAGAVGTASLYAREDHAHAGPTQAVNDGRYVLKTGDTMTGDLNLTGTADISVAGPNVLLGAAGDLDTTSKLSYAGSMHTLGAGARVYKDLYLAATPVAETVGTLKIGMPKSWTTEIMSIVLKGHDFGNGPASVWEVVITGYSYAATPAWLFTSATILGNPPFGSNIRLGHDGTRLVILLGTTVTKWNSALVYVAEFRNTYTGGTSYGWGTGWSHALITSETGITNIVTPASITRYVNTTGDVMTGPLNIVGSAPGTTLLSTQVAGDSGRRLYLNSDGPIYWGPGNANADTNLYRSQADWLATDDSFNVLGPRVLFGSAGYNDSSAKLNVGGAYHTVLSGTANLHVFRDVLGDFKSGNTTGTLKITLPKGFVSEWVSVNIRGYDYSGREWQVVIGGYLYAGSTQWLAYNCYVLGRPPFATNIRLAYDGTKALILLGTTTTTWAYTYYHVAEVRSNNGGWGSPWTGTWITDETGITGIVSPPIQGMLDGSTSTPAAVASAGAAGTSAQYARGDHVHSGGMPGNAVPQPVTPGVAGVPGDSLNYSRENHTHQAPAPASATPAAVGSAGAVGSSTLYARQDHVHSGAQPGTATPGATAAAGVVGTSALYSREDHVHASPQLATGTDFPNSVGTFNDPGSGVRSARFDHTHGGPAPGTATPKTLGYQGAVGVATLYAREDHVHGSKVIFAGHPAANVSAASNTEITPTAITINTANLFTYTAGSGVQVPFKGIYALRFKVLCASGTAAGCQLWVKNAIGATFGYAAGYVAASTNQTIECNVHAIQLNNGDYVRLWATYPGTIYALDSGTNAVVTELVIECLVAN